MPDALVPNAPPGGAPYRLREIEHCWIAMPDGVRLSARLWLPATDRPVPAILEYIPYRKRDMVRARDERNHPHFARAGYASVRVDMRGSGDSEGVMTDMYTPEELDDAHQVIAWLAAQDWCNGSVGMMGTSWGGTAALQAATNKPSDLKAVIAVCATNDRFEDDIHHMGGCLLTDTLEWGAALPAILALPPDPETVGEAWRAQWMARLEAAAFPLENWVRHETRTDYWRHGSVSQTGGTLGCPTLAIGGWVDRYSNSVMNLVAANPDRCWGIVGPWGHHYPDKAEPGPGIDFQQVAIAWWDRWLRGKANGADRAPRLRVWMQSYDRPRDRRRTSSGRWVAERAWPSESTSTRTFFPSADGGLSSTPDFSSGEAQVPFSVCGGLAAGDTGYFGRIGGLPLDQNSDDADCLVFETAPLAETIEILGRTRLSVALSEDAGQAVLAARLVDVAPDGRASRVSWAVRNTALDDDLSSPRSPGNSLTIEFPNTAYSFAPGHRMRLTIGTNYWPQIWPGSDTSPLSIRLAGTELCLPLRPKTDSEAVDLPIVDGGASGSSPDRSISSTPGGRTRVAWHQPAAAAQFPDIGRSIASETEACHDIDDGDPASAVSTYTHALTLRRPDGTIRTTGRVELTSDGETYALHGSLDVTENNEVIFRREWSPRVPRRHS